MIVIYLMLFLLIGESALAQGTIIQYKTTTNGCGPDIPWIEGPKPEQFPNPACKQSAEQSFEFFSTVIGLQSYDECLQAQSCVDTGGRYYECTTSGQYAGTQIYIVNCLSREICECGEDENGQCVPCGCEEGKKAESTYDLPEWNDNGPRPLPQCHKGCMYNYDSSTKFDWDTGGYVAVGWVSTDQTCENPVQPPLKDSDTGDCDCQIQSDGREICLCTNIQDCPVGAVCTGTDSPNCGFFNGSAICHDTSPDGDCVFIENGDYVCSSDAPAPLRPTDEQGNPADPDLIMSDPDTGDSTDVYQDGSSGSGGGGNNNSGGSSNAEFCTDNPDSLICKKGQFQANCGKSNGAGYNFICKQDPVLCGTAEYQFKLYCESKYIKDGFTDYIKDNTTLDGYDHEAAAESLYETIDIEDEIGEVDFDQTAFIASSGNCSSHSVTLLGHAVTFDFQPFCDLGNTLRPLFIFLMTFVSALITLKVGFREV